ncbi:MAG TPA: hypothetical protein VFS67_29700, partial [Polyangiaceae bacterium]|nr:hypothetical protein [Polyangiaceae bacterium]
EQAVSPYDKCAFCGGELTTGGCVNFACSSKVILTLPMTTAERSLLQDTEELESRIAALTAELEQSKADFDSVAELKAIAEAEFARLREYAAGCEKTAVLNQMENVQLKLDLATERAAREQAEKERDYWRNGCESEQEGKAVLVDDLEQAERKRDECKAAREKAEECATELRGQYAEKSEALILTERERDAALARVEELTVKHDLLAERSIHTESALASALSLLGRAHQFGISHPAIRRDVGAFLSSAPSPAPCYGCAAARELLVTADEPYSVVQWRIERDSWLKEHGNG